LRAKNDKRKTRFELATLALARRCSTAELLPHPYAPPPRHGHRVDFSRFRGFSLRGIESCGREPATYERRGARRYVADGGRGRLLDRRLLGDGRQRARVQGQHAARRPRIRRDAPGRVGTNKHRTWAREESNLHGFPHRILSPARLPIPPHARRRRVLYRPFLVRFGPHVDEIADGAVRGGQTRQEVGRTPLVVAGDHAVQEQRVADRVHPNCPPRENGIAGEGVA
jgi:hypothetical protein